VEIKIKILQAAKRQVPKAAKPTMVDACRGWVEAVEERGVEESAEAWEKIRQLQNKLMKVKDKSDLHKVLLRILAPVVQKYATFDPKGVEFDATYLREDD
jgi:DNA polymerase I-like protein with 3'-5' exonuclease and polymerase domains